MEVPALSPFSSAVPARAAGGIVPRGWPAVHGHPEPVARPDSQGQRTESGWAVVIVGLLLVTAGGLFGCGGSDSHTASGDAQRSGRPTGSDSHGAPSGARPTFPPLVRAPVWTPPPIGVIGEDEVTPTPTVLLPVRLLGKHVGEYLEITLDNGKVLRVIVLALNERSVKVTETVGGGEIRYEVPMSTVRGFQLAR